MACSICREPYHNRRRCPDRPPDPPPAFVREVKLKGDGVLRLRFRGDPLKLSRTERRWLHGVMNLIDDYEGKP